MSSKMVTVELTEYQAKAMLSFFYSGKRIFGKDFDSQQAGNLTQALKRGFLKLKTAWWQQCVPGKSRP